MIEGFGDIFNADLVVRFVINFATICVLILFSYFRRSSNNEFLFGAVLFGVGVFIITKILNGVKLPMGFAFGLFALFSMLRYRTESITIKEMTYLFLVIGVALISGIAPVGYFGLIIINLCICVLAEAGEYVESKVQIYGHKASQVIRYDLIENIKPQRREQLFQDLKSRTGLNVLDVKINEIDLLRDTALITIIYSKTFDAESIENSESVNDSKVSIMDIKRNAASDSCNDDFKASYDIKASDDISRHSIYSSGRVGE